MAAVRPEDPGRWGQRSRMKSPGSRGGRSGGGPAGCPTATAPIGSKFAGRSSTSRTTSRQNIVLLTQAEPRPSTGQRDEQVLDARAHRDEEHLALGGAAPLVGIGVRPVGDQARDDQQRRAAQHVTAPGPPRDLLVGEPVPPQVVDPGGEHRVEQPVARLRRPHDDDSATASCDGARAR